MASKELNNKAPCQKVHITATTTSRGSQHISAHQPEVMDPSLWSTLPEDLLVHVFAHLPMQQIFTIRSLSKAWSAIAITEGFKRICAKAHPKLFGIFSFGKRVGRRVGQFQLAAFDLEYSKCMYPELKQVPMEYRRVAKYEEGAITKHGALHAHDGGLVCFVSTRNLSVLVCNPLTNDRKKLPLPLLSKELYKGQVIMVQLLADPATRAYKVMLVCWHGGTRVPWQGSDASISKSAIAYDSTTGMWNTMTSGYVYGHDYTSYNIPKVFECSSGSLSHQSFTCIARVLVKNNLFKLHYSFPYNGPDEVSELRQDSPGVMTEVDRFISTMADLSQFYVVMFGCNGFILLVAFKWDLNTSECHQRMHLYDTCRHEWQELPGELPLLNDEKLANYLRNHFMCELRWDVLP